MHLSSEGISQFIAGDGLPADHEHLQSCDECHAEVRKLQSALSSYGGFARDWGRGEAPAAPHLSQLLRETHRPARVMRWGGLAVAAAAAILVLVFRQVPPALPADSAEDALLLQQVNAQISRTAPLAMDPLLLWMEDNDSTGEKQ